jgi:hypothetical protein
MGGGSPINRKLCAVALSPIVAGLFLAFTATCAQARASQWWYVAHGADRVLYVDVGSIEREGDTVGYWASQILRDPENPAAALRAYMRTDCAKRTETWLMVVRYDSADERLDPSALSYADAEAVEAGSLGEAQLDFVCAADRAQAGGFPLAIDEVAFAQALIANEDGALGPAALHEKMRADPKMPVVRSSAPGPETFGTAQQAVKGHAIVPPRDYAKGIEVPQAQAYDADETGTIYDIAYWGIQDGELTFEQRGYSINDLAHSGSGQMLRFPVDQKNVQILDIAIEILATGPDSLRFRATRTKRESAGGEEACPADDCVK